MLQHCSVQRYIIYKQNYKTMKQIVLLVLVLLPFCVYSQINETFDGPEIPAIWLGKDRDKFAIRPDGRLELNLQPSTSGEISIGLNIPYSANMQWEFDVLMSGVPSDNNKLWAFLYREGDSFYNVQIGYSGSQKLGLRSDGKDLFARKTNDYKKDSWVHIKVTLEENRCWTLYSRPHSVTYYTKEGSCIHPVKPAEQGQFSFKFVYTKTMSKLFSIDNVRIGNTITPTDTVVVENPDTPPSPPTELPQLQDILVLTPSSLQFVFDKAVQIEKATFSVSNIGDAIDKSYADASNAIINTLFPEALQAGNTYTISYKEVTDLSGHTLPAYADEMLLEEDDDDQQGASPGSVQISEVMADPKGLTYLPETEYIELYNTTNTDLSLAGWQLLYGGSAKPIGNVALPAGVYAVLYRAGREIEVDITGRAVPLDNFPSALANTGKGLQLLDATGRIIDDTAYPQATPGQSWERTPSGTWQLSSDPRGGTPGSVPALSQDPDPEEPTDPEDPEDPDQPEEPIPTPILVLPGEIIFNELLPDPFAGGSEYLELYNRSNRSLPLSGLSVAVRKADGSLSTRYPLSSIHQEIEPGGYALLTKSKEDVAAFYLIAAPKALYEIPKLPVLANTASVLVLFRTADEMEIDCLAYSSKWHASSVKSAKGVALERIDPDEKTQDPANWTSAAATAGFGTPGYRNSQSGTLPPGEATGIEAPVYIEDGHYYIIRYLVDRAGYNCRAYIFNTSGLRVAEVANHELLGTVGQLSWDGSASDGGCLQPGVYIFYAELYHPEGTVKAYKKVFLAR